MINSKNNQVNSLSFINLTNRGYAPSKINETPVSRISIQTHQELAMHKREEKIHQITSLLKRRKKLLSERRRATFAESKQLSVKIQANESHYGQKRQEEYENQGVFQQNQVRKDLSAEKLFVPKNISTLHSSFRINPHKHCSKYSYKAFMPAFLTSNDELISIRKAQNIYIKTSAGKREKIDPNLYFKRIKERLKNSNFSNSNLMLTSNEEDFNSDCKNNSLMNSKPKAILSLLDSQTKAGTSTEKKRPYCRPWSTCASEANIQ